MSGVFQNGMTQLNHPDGSAFVRSLRELATQFSQSFRNDSHLGLRLLRKVLGEYTRTNLRRSTKTMMTQTAA